MHNARLLLPALLFFLSCGGVHKQEVEDLKLEVQKDRILLQETRAELQALIEQLKPLIQLSSLASGAMSPSLSEVQHPEMANADNTAPEDQDAKIYAGIRAISGTEFEVTRSVVDAILDNPVNTARGARIVPSIKAGRANGFKLYAIVPSSIYAKLGFKNGDTVHSINGHVLTSPDKALEAYSSLKTATKMVVSITRRGQKLELRYTIK